MSSQKRFRKYREAETGNTDPIKNNTGVSSSNDNKIDDDFPGYPRGNAKEEIINPETSNDFKTADLENKDGEKRESRTAGQTDEISSDGSASAFDAVEQVKE